jgi:Ran GTPase-activating protein (RanGAP) involved in mRNA processing and transport
VDDITVEEFQAGKMTMVFPPQCTMFTISASSNDIDFALFAEALGSNTKITAVILADIGMGDVDATALAVAFQVNTAIANADLSRNDIGAAGAASLATALATNSAIKILDLSYNSVGRIGAAALAEVFKTNFAIASVDLRMNQIGDGGAHSLAEALKVNTAIQRLDLSSNNIGPVGAASLAEALKVNSVLQKLELTLNILGFNGAAAVADALEGNSALTSLALSANGIGASGTAVLAAALTANTVILGVGLDSNAIGDAGAASLADMLMVNTAITRLDLSANGIGPVGAASLAEAFKANTALTRVELNYNSIADAGAASLAEALKVNTVITDFELADFNTAPEWNEAFAWLINNAANRNAGVCNGAGILSLSGNCQCSGLALLGTGPTCSDLSAVPCFAKDIGLYGLQAGEANLLDLSHCRVLDLRNCNIQSTEAAALADAFQRITNEITTVNVAYNNIGDDGAVSLALAFKIVTSLTSVDLSTNAIGDAGAVLFAEAFKASAVEYLDFSGNSIGDKGAASFAEAFKSSAVAYLDFSGNSIGDIGASSLAEACRLNTGISTLDLNGNRIGEEWTAAIAWLVSTSSKRSVVECSGFGIISPQSGKCQCSGLAGLGSGPTCSDVVCGANDIGLARFQEGTNNALSIPARCTELDLNDQHIFDDGAAALAFALLNNTSVVRVALHSNLIGDRGAGSFAEAFKVNNVVTAVNFSSNNIGNLGAAALARALEVNTAITTVDLSGNVLGDSWVSALRCYSPSAAVGAICNGKRVTRKPAAGWVTPAISSLALVVIAGATLLYKRIRHKSPSSAEAVAAQLVAFARERAAARFVVEYRQLVSAKSMEQFQLELQQLEAPRATVKLGAELGRGQSGVVYRGVLADTSIDLAIKTRGNSGLDVGAAAAVADEGLILEAMLLNGLRHPGIVTLLAVVTAEAPILICTELMTNGDLRGYLRTARIFTERPSTSISANSQAVAVTPQVMIAMAARLSSAMAYIEHKQIIHRDVAARNVLVGANASDVKIADLGAARNVHRTSEHVYNGVYVASSDHTPARWMALEALREAKFSHKADVFAFGVLLWEILSFGQTPWGAFGVHEFSQSLANGERLPFPPGLQRDSNPLEVRSAKAIYAIAVRCWKQDPAKRPHFHQLEAEFSVRHTVITTTGAVVSNTASADGLSTRRCPDADEGFIVGKLGIEQNSPRLDAGGYVADTGFDVETVLDADGYVADAGLVLGPTLDADGRVADPPAAEVQECTHVAWGARAAPLGSSDKSEAAPRDEDDKRMTLQLTDRRTTHWLDQSAALTAADASAVHPRSDVADRKAEKPSLHIGFETGPPSTTGMQDDETRL